MKFRLIALALAAATVTANAAVLDDDIFSAKGFFVNANAQTTSKSDIKDGGGDVSTTNYGVTVGNEVMSLRVERTDYNFSDEDGDFDGLNKIVYDIHNDGFVTTNLSYSLGLSVGSLFEDNIDISDSYMVSPRVAFGWTFTNGMTAFFGAYANLNGADNIYLPILGLKLGADKDRGFSGAIAYPATFVQYRFNPSLAVDTTFMTVRDTYHLDSDSARGLASDGYFREEAYGISTGVKYNIGKLELSGGVFSYFDREFKLYDHNGGKLGSVEVDPNVGIYARIGCAY